MKTLGICFGASTLQAVIVHADNDLLTVTRSERIIHDGNPLAAYINFIKTVDLPAIDRIVLTGRSLRSQLSLTTISESEAVEYALSRLYKKESFPQYIVSLGGETQLVYAIDHNGYVSGVHTGNKCASGTGEFFVQQISRMGLSIAEAVPLAVSGKAHRVAGRCSVFCKSDCTHALNIGTPRENVVAGLCEMMADKIVELIHKSPIRPVALIGGGTQNSRLVSILKERLDRTDIADHATVFEAFGAAVWALSHECVAPEDYHLKQHAVQSSFGFLAPLNLSESLVNFADSNHGKITAGHIYVLGLDVGSTTTKAVLVDRSDQTMCASIYLRTCGNPIVAACACYQSIADQIGSIPVVIDGIGVTGSGRAIAALHALTQTVVNEITAHAAAAAFYDNDVDTIFEIGGQDAKYTVLTNGVPTDYAMNEACSAGTGSFLEESARESLNIATEEIGALAMQGSNPPNFTDQCSAFISSDIKRAMQEGIGRSDILAGLVYSIALNYLNRVKGARPVGKKIFMQGGVCYNKAVPTAIASILKVPIVVPPDPGLMGAFGVALETIARVKDSAQHYDLKILAHRTARQVASFSCAGGRDHCDRGCEIARIEIENKLYPFGGACTKYSHYTRKSAQSVDSLDQFPRDLVALRQKLLFETYGINHYNASQVVNRNKPVIGISRSFLTNSLFPLFSNFFAELGCAVVLSDIIDPQGIKRVESAFCFPAELGHGSFLDLINKKVDYIFLPQVMQVPVPNVPTYSRMCVFVQGEPYYLQTTFRDELKQNNITILAPVLKMENGYPAALDALAASISALGFDFNHIKRAYALACKKQVAFEGELKSWGRKALKYLETKTDQFGIVLFGRSYSAFAREANKGIPYKFASRNHIVIPHDMLSVDEYDVDEKMFWATGQQILKAAQLVHDRPNLFGVYITNFSCGPDSFLLGFFRTIMKNKPSLTLELDQHTADAGVDTRIEAVLDIMASSRQLSEPSLDNSFTPAHIDYANGVTVVSSNGNRYSMYDREHVEILLPSMGAYSTKLLAALLRSRGMNAIALPIPDHDVLLEGRKHTSCKECLPYILTTGSFITALKNRPRKPGMVTLLFMATGGGPCRLGQYGVAQTQLIERLKLSDVAMLTITDENGYAGLGSLLLLKAWQSIVVADVMSEVRSMLHICAADKTTALQKLDEVQEEVVRFFEGRFSIRFSTLLSMISLKLKNIPLEKNPASIPVVSLIGEIFVRREEFSRKNIVDYLESHGFMVKVAPIAEYLCYGNYVINTGLGERVFTLREKFKMRLTARIQEWWEERIKSILARSGLYRFEMIDVATTIAGVKHIVNENFRGETILTIGLAMREILHDSCGVISIGPFGCMPSRMAEAMLKTEMNMAGKQRMQTAQRHTGSASAIQTFPYLALETDGNPFPQTIEASLETFVVQAKRLHSLLQQRQKRR